MEIKDIIKWFEIAKPNPTAKDVGVQFGCHLEEIEELARSHDATFDLSVIAMGFKKGVMQGELLAPELSQNVDTLDALCDQIVTAIGLGYMLGFDMAGALSEVNKSNWSKFVDGSPMFDEDGKIAKSSNYKAPELSQFLGDKVFKKPLHTGEKTELSEQEENPEDSKE